MALAVVDMLEMIDIDIEQRDWLFRPRGSRLPHDVLGKESSVRKPGQGIMHGKMRKPCLDAALLGHILGNAENIARRLPDGAGSARFAVFRIRNTPSTV